MMYNSLLLKYGGGILPSTSQSMQHDSAAVVIGIGGTGVAALAELKRKVYQQLIPDHPDEPMPRYDHIQFLAIDSDETDIDGMHGEARLNKFSEFFSIGNSHLRAALSAKDMIKNNPVFNWMEIDQISSLLFPAGAGGIRQVGRYLLLTKAAALKAKIEEKCTIALKGLSSPSLDIYIFAGLSGATGGGCFLDTCYIVRKILEEHGWDSSASITGLFFLPDVVTSKPAVAANPVYRTSNYSNGYAAMKELDYLMDLKSGNDFFQQNYGAFSVNTQKPPVDLCYLISATRSDGTLPPNNFLYCIHVASNYVLNQLTDTVPLPSHHFFPDLHPISHSPYHVMGAASVEIPTAQIATYLAAKFYRHFQDTVGAYQVAITKSEVDEWVQKLGLTANQVYNELVRNCDDLFLPEIDRKELANYGVIPRGKAPQPWATPGNAWIDHCFGKRTQKRAALNASLETFDIDQVSTDSLIGRVFHKLYALSMDPNYGPYYAAGLLNHAGYDLMSALDGAIRQAEEERLTQNTQLHGNSFGSGYDEYAMQCSAYFCQKPSKKNYQLYMDAIQQWYLLCNRCNECDDLITTLRTLKNDLAKLYQSYFLPLITLLNGLKDTFAENLQALSGNGSAPTPCTHFLLSLEELRPKLDTDLDRLDYQALIRQFMAYILEGYEHWIRDEDVRIGWYISRYMKRVFDSQINRSLENYLFDLFPQTEYNPTLLAQEIETHILPYLHNAAAPVLRSQYTFDLSSLPQNSMLLIPANGAALHGAATSFTSSHPSYLSFSIERRDCMSVLRRFSGLPLWVFADMEVWKNAYDNIQGTPLGSGIHLYTQTGRGTDGSGEKDWHTLLPDLMS